MRSRYSYCWIALWSLTVGLLLQVQARHDHVKDHNSSRSGPDHHVELLEDEERIDYDNFTLLKIEVRHEKDVDVLNLLQHHPGVDFWKLPNVITKSADVLLSPQVHGYITQRLEDSNISYSISADNIKTIIETTSPTVDYDEMAALKDRTGHSMNFKAYHRYDTIVEFLDYIGKQGCTGCETLTLGYSYEGRKLAGIKCGRGNRSIVIEGGIHAREWISPAVVSYIVNEMGKDREDQLLDVTEILDLYTVYLIPLLNPDGYEYTHTHNRLWRKTRSINRVSTGCKGEKKKISKCRGVDGNRNFDIHWGEVGSSKSPCTDIYQGERPFSENETSAIRDFFRDHHNVDLYLSLHSYSQLILLPYGYTKEQPDNYEKLLQVANIGNQALQDAGGPAFGIDQPPRILYAASGSSYDWVKVKAGVPYSYTIELRDHGKYGFLLPPCLIEQSGRETLAAVLAMARAVSKGPCKCL